MAKNCLKIKKLSFFIRCSLLQWEFVEEVFLKIVNVYMQQFSEAICFEMSLATNLRSKALCQKHNEARIVTFACSIE